MTEIITTSLKNSESDIKLAQEIGQKHQLVYKKRNNHSINEFMNIQDVTAFFLIKNNVLSHFDSSGNELFFHPGTGLIRVKMLEKCQEDLLISALGISTNDSVLDCTMGLANDSLVIAYYLEHGEVTALEKSQEIYLVTKYGLKSYMRGSQKLKQALQRIIVENCNYNDYFDKCLEPSNYRSFDSIYFDPMFKKPVIESSGISKLRPFASYDELNMEIIEKALKVARKRVVVKIRNNDFSFVKSTLPSEILGGSRSNIRYAVYENK